MRPGLHEKVVLETSVLALAQCQACLALCLSLHSFQVTSHVSNLCYWQQQPKSYESCITGQCGVTGLCCVQGSCLSSLLCSIFLADLESTHLQDLLPQASRHPSARVQPHLHPSQPTSGCHPASSSAAHLTDLAQAAERNEQPLSEMCLGTRPSQRGADLSQDTGAASQAGRGPVPAQEGYSTARERLPQADSNLDEHMDEDNGEQWLTQPSQTDAEPSQHNCSNGSWLHALSTEVYKEGEAWNSQSASQAGTGSVMPLLDTDPACCDDEATEQQQDCQQLKRQRLTQMPALLSPPVDNTLPEHEAHQPPASSTKGASCQSPGHKSNFDQRDGQKAKRGLVAAAGVAGKGSDRRAPRLQSLLMRLIDDFLFITPSRTAAEALVNKLLKGKLRFLTSTLTSCCTFSTKAEQHIM